MHITFPEALSIAGPVVTLGLGVANIAQINRIRRIDTRNKVLEDAAKADASRVDNILRERTELYDENRTLRTDLRTEIERLKDDIKQSRLDAETWRLAAADWEKKYEKELIANVSLRSDNETMKTDIKRLQSELSSLRTRFDGVAQPISASTPVASVRTITTTDVIPDTHHQ